MSYEHGTRVAGVAAASLEPTAIDPETYGLVNMHDLAIIIVSTNEAQWLRPCLSTILERAEGVAVDVVVANNESTDGTRELVESEFPGVRVIDSENRGFAHANNRALMTCDARYVLFINPDTEIVEGSWAELIKAMDDRPSLGLAGVCQRTGDGKLFPTIRRFPNALRSLGEALGSERLPWRNQWIGERELDLSRYEREVACDWTTGAFMLARREAIESAGFLDERFFIYSEETDLCLRIKRAGWDIHHLPYMTIIHHAGKAGANPKMEAQNAFARMQYARKHFSPGHRAIYATALLIRYLLRWMIPGGRGGASRRNAAGHALRTLVGLADPPFGTPPPHAVALRRIMDARPSPIGRDPAELTRGRSRAAESLP